MRPLSVAAAATLMLGLGTSPRAEATACSPTNPNELNCLRAGYRPTIAETSLARLDTYQCGGRAQAGPESVREMTCDYSQWVMIDVRNMDCDVDFYVLEDVCDTDEDCIAWNAEAGESGIFTADFWCDAGRTYYVVVEAWALANQPASCPRPSFISPRQVSWDIRAICPEACDGNDRDWDGDVDCADTDCCDDPSCPPSPACCDRDQDGSLDIDPSCGGDDCDDSNGSVRPGLFDVPADGIDQDCDGVDDCFQDLDGDGYGSDLIVGGDDLDCTNLDGESDNDLDCLDVGTDAEFANPDGVERPADGIDQDCDGVDLCYLDADGDGYAGEVLTPGLDLSCFNDPGYGSAPSDCRDIGAGAAVVHPGADEVCNSFDDDCDELVDDADSDLIGGVTAWRDADGDGYGDANDTVTACEAPEGYIARAGDCDDDDGTVNPAADEVVGDGIDQDCDGVDDCYVDADGDGFGGLAVVAGDDRSCFDEPGLASVSGDCQDQLATANPDADEICNGFDDDCDDLVDDEDPDRIGGNTLYADADGDTYGDPQVSQLACGARPGFVSNDQDCDDTPGSGALVNPDGQEVLGNGADEDCDGGDRCYVDADGDGWGTAAEVADNDLVCGNGDGLAAQTGDCLDAGSLGAAVFPGAPELCNGRDDDCDDLVDDVDPDVVDATTWYADVDGDSWGDSEGTALACQRPIGFVARGGDCDDQALTVSPDAEERCNGFDDDCDELVDDDDVLPPTLQAWPDEDGDGFGDPSQPLDLAACELPSGFVANDLDCDDEDPTVRPGVDEVPYDGIDQDCSGADLTDVDGDGFDGGTGPDCVDTDVNVRPGAAELADGVDQDCDGLVDEGTVRFDDDGDGFAELGGDCDDADATISPAATERPDAVDQDCDGIVDEGTNRYDDDGDGQTELEQDCNDADATVYFGAPLRPGSGIDVNCDGVVDGTDGDGDGYTDRGGDCDDTDPAVRPGAPERPNGLDDDCDGSVDEGTVRSDDDGDGETEEAGDCDDSDSAISTTATEVPGNFVDDDCDGTVDEGGRQTDDDGDGYTEDAGDCDDVDASIFPYAPERDNAVDDDCDGLVDEGIIDVDEDGYISADDCDDRDGWANPGADEVCDGIDNDCDGSVDEGCGDRTEADPVEPDISDDKGCASTGGAPVGWLALLGAVARRRGRHPVRG